jgi:hypothetical protein
MQMNPSITRASSVRRSIRSKCRSIATSFERKRPAVESWLLLLFFEFIMKFRRSQVLRDIVCNESVRPIKASAIFSDQELVHAMDLACVFYFKRVLCLQRSSATTILLRRHGRRAEMVTGAQISPFEFHAWTEIGNAVINDKPYMHEIYQVLERF